MICPLASIQDAAAVVGPSAAAVAAVASWVGVRQVRKIAIASTVPALSIQPTIDARTLGIGATIHNAGEGAGRGVWYIIARGDHYAMGYVGHGVVRSDEFYDVKTPIVGDPDSVGSGDPSAALVVGCHDQRGYLHAWTHKGRHRMKKGWLGRPPRSENLENVFRRIQRGRRLEGFTQVNSQVIGPR